MKKRNFSSKLTLKKVTIAKLDGDKMTQFVGGIDTRTVVGSDKLCDKSRISPALCKIVVEPKDPITSKCESFLCPSNFCNTK